VGMPGHNRTVFKIPDRHRNAIKSLVQLTEDQAQALEKALQSAAPRLSIGRLATDIESKAGLPQAQLEPILAALISLAVAAEQREEPFEEVAEAVANRAVEEKLDLEPAAVASFKKRLSSLLAIETSIGVTARAFGLVLEHERTAVATRILTDIRPIFMGDGIKPVAAMVVHTLKIESHKEEGHVSHFFALDIDDLVELKKAVDRAIRKEENLKASIAKGDLSFIDAHSE
jgi:hypothetical protein